MFRAHGTDAPREIWRFGEPGDPLYEALVKSLQLRYRLLPYIYSLAGWTTHQAYTMLRALPFDFRYDPAVYNVADQFMFGPALLVNPVTQPMYYTRDSVPVADVRKTRSVYLPAGTDWYDFWTDQHYQGGQTIEASATLDVIPLYVRAGSIIPMGPCRQHVGDQPAAPIELHLYPGANGHFLLYEDEGDSYRYEQGALATIRIEWDNAARRLTLGQRLGQYPGMPEQREFRLVLHDVKSGERRVPYHDRPVVVDL
jgi:alpha-D-xyloside xylohydrolase